MTQTETASANERATMPSPVEGITVVIPAFDEEGAIRDEVEKLHSVLTAAPCPFEIIVVDDGSRDRTASIAAELPCRLIRQPRNMGYGAALKRGIAAARNPLVVITDADGTYPAEAIPELVEKAAGFDMVVGARVGDEVRIPWTRRPAKWFLRVLASYLAEYPIPDLNSGLRVMRREHVRRFAHILPRGFSFTTTITLSYLCSGLTVGYLPIDYRRRIGTSKIRPSHAWQFLLLILRVIVLFNPLKVFLPAGALVFLVGAAKFIYDVGIGNLSESAVMCILTALMLWSIGLLADQNSRLGLDRESWPS